VLATPNSEESLFEKCIHHQIFMLTHPHQMDGVFKKVTSKNESKLKISFKKKFISH